MNIFENPDLVTQVVDYLGGIPGYGSINTTMNKIAMERLDQYLKQLNTKYPLWDITVGEEEGVTSKHVQDVALYHLNVATLEGDYDAVRAIAEFHKSDPQILIDAINLLFVNGNTSLSLQLYRLYRSLIPDNVGFSIIDYYDSIERGYDVDEFAHRTLQKVRAHGFNSTDAAILVNKKVSRKVKPISMVKSTWCERPSLLDTVVRRVPGIYDAQDLNLLGSIALNPTNLSLAIAEIDIEGMAYQGFEKYTELLCSLRYHTIQTVGKLRFIKNEYSTCLKVKDLNPLIIKYLKLDSYDARRSSNSVAHDIVLHKLQEGDILNNTKRTWWGIPALTFKLVNKRRPRQQAIYDNRDACGRDELIDLYGDDDLNIC